MIEKKDREIPNMKGREFEGKCEILLDERWVYIFPDKTSALLSCEMAANAMAIGAGYSNFKAKSKAMPFATVYQSM